jgi:hypothetical protein
MNEWIDGYVDDGENTFMRGSVIDGYKKYIFISANRDPTD